MHPGVPVTLAVTLAVAEAILVDVADATLVDVVVAFTIAVEVEVARAVAVLLDMRVAVADAALVLTAVAVAVVVVVPTTIVPVAVAVPPLVKRRPVNRKTWSGSALPATQIWRLFHSRHAGLRLLLCRKAAKLLAGGGRRLSHSHLPVV